MLLLHSVCLHQVHDQVQTIQIVGTMDSPLALCFDTFTLGHTLILSFWHWLVRMYAGSPFCLEMFWHQSLSMLYMQPGFFIHQSACKGLESDSWIFVNSIGVHAGTHPICCLVRLFRQLGLQNLFQSFFYRGTCISDVHTGAYPILVLWSEMDVFFHE